LNGKDGGKRENNKGYRNEKEGRRIERERQCKDVKQKVQKNG
jgi:hypothetical protein